MRSAIKQLPVWRRSVIVAMYCIMSIIVPIVLLSMYLLIDRTYRLPSAIAGAELVVQAVAVLAGAVLVSLIPVGFGLRALLVVLFIPCMWIFLYWYIFAFVGNVFGDWL